LQRGVEEDWRAVDGERLKMMIYMYIYYYFYLKLIKRTENNLNVVFKLDRLLKTELNSNRTESSPTNSSQFLL
jgi:hypothetical protein